MHINYYNIIFIVVDALRCDALSCYGPTKYKTPNIDSIANDGTLFTNHYSVATSSWMGSYALFTGLPPYVFDIESLAKVDFNTERYLSLAHILKEYGYHMITTTGEIGDKYAPIPWKAPRKLREEKIFEPFDFIKHTHRWKGTTDRWLWGISTYDAPIVCDWLAKNNSPFFLHYYPADAHVSIRDRNFRKVILSDGSEKDYINNKVSDNDQVQTYYDRVAYVDHQLGLIINKLKTLNLYNDALIIVTTDHGETLGERGSSGHGLVSQLFQGNIHTPLIIKTPNHRYKPIIETIVSSIDVFPTITDILNVNVDYGNKMSALGKSLLPLLRGEQNIKHHKYVYAETRWPREKDRSVAYIDSDGWKLIYGKTGIRELYDLCHDAEEKNNLYDMSYDPYKRIIHYGLFLNILLPLRRLLTTRGRHGYRDLKKGTIGFLKAIYGYVNYKCKKNKDSKCENRKTEEIMTLVLEKERNIQKTYCH